ncbi:hypothetical protein N9J76_01210 [Candidatus Pelagibacter sp.]|nr:hypothetical protein [Candidatus Pelagibacter sp.]
MLKQLNKVVKISFLILILGFSKAYSIEGAGVFTDAIDVVREEFNNISEASTEQSKIIDEAMKQIDKATEYVQEAINQNNAEDAIKTLEFIEKSLSDVESIIPQEFESDMSKIDVSVISKEDMDVVNEVTAQMKTVKEEKLKDFMSDLVNLNQKGIDTVTISENLNSLGIATIKLDLEIKEKKKMETWTKEEWANSYKGSILTSSGEEVITDKEINSKVVDLEQKLQANKSAIVGKRSSLTELQTKIDPLSGQIKDLKTQKTDLLAKYNEEIIKQSSNILSDDEINKSKGLADEFNSQLSNLTSQIKTAEEQSNSLQQQVQGLNLEITNEISTKAQLEQNINNLSNQLLAGQNSLSKKELELDQLKNTDLNSKVNELNSELQSVSRQRDFIQTDFERSIDLEVEALKRYHSALGDTAEEIDFAMREVDVVLDSDPRKARAFEIEKYATYAGFSKDQIQKGIDAVNNDDWDTQKEVFKNITKGLSKNPNWEVNVPSDAEFNVMIEEEKAIQAAVFQSMELEKVKEQVQNSINEKTKNIQPLVGLNTTWIQYSNLQSNVIETDLVVKEMNEILKDNQQYQIKKEQIDNLQKTLDDLNNNASKYKADYDQRITQATQSFNNIETQIRQHNQNSNWGNSSWVSQRRNLYDQRINLFNAVREPFDNKKNQVFYEKNKIELQISSDFYSAQSQARENIVKKVEEAEIQYNSIVEKETQALKEIQSKVANTLKEVPTFEANADSVSGLDPAMLRAKLSDITSGSNNDVEALEAARKAMSEMTDKPVSEFMTGPYWEMTNVKAAAIVRSKKYDYVDDYEYINAYYRDPLELNSSQRSEVESELKDVLGKNNMKLQAINTKVDSLTNELSLTKDQSQNLTAEISTLENELTSLKSSESEIQNQISDLSNQFSSKESLINEKQKGLASLKEQLNPLSDKMTELEGQRAELDTKLNNQLNTIATQIESKGQATEEANTLKTQFESQITELDSQLQNYEKETVKINTQLTSLTSELTSLETETPEISSQIKNLNQDLENFVNIKADLAMAVAEKYDLEVQEKVINAVKPLENKSIISIEGSNLFRVVDTDELINDKGKFKLPTGTLTLKGEVYTAGAVQPEKLFSFVNINNDQEINSRILELEQKFEAGNINEKELREQRDSINATRSNMKIEYSEAAAAQFANSGKLVGGEQAYNNSTLGSWVLVNATTGDQMTNPLTGHSGSMVCEGSVCGLDGELGKQASAFGAMYVLESLADEKGNVSGICGQGGCKFDVDTLRVLGPDGIANNVFNDKGEGLFQQAFTSTEINEIEKYGMTTLQRQNAIAYAVENNIEIDASKLVDQDSLNTQSKALAYAAKNNTFVSEINKQAGAYTKFKTDTFQQIAVTDVGKEIQEAAKQASEATTEVAAAAKEATESVKETVAEVTKTVAEVTKTASKTFLTGNDLAELSKLANDAHGSWVLVDAATGKQMADPLTGHVGAHAGRADMMSATGDFGKAAAEFGGVYVLENLASETGNVSSRCGSGDCQFNIGN